MQLGIKTGLKGDYQAEITQAKPDFVEVWFNAGKADHYQDLFGYLKRQKVPFGLHFWGALPDQTLANLAYPDRMINHESFKLYRLTLEIAARHRCLYLNLHPAGYRLTRVDFQKEEFKPFSKPAAKKICLINFIHHLSSLGELGQKLGVQILVESAPKYANGTPWTGPAGRLQPVYIGEIPVTDLALDLFNLPNIYFANDFGHTASALTNVSRTQISDFLITTTRKFFDHTRLLHIGYLLPPYIGTDYHGSLLYQEFSTDAAVPNKSEMIKLLKLFVKRADVLALVEPESNHVGNFQALNQLVLAC